MIRGKSHKCPFGLSITDGCKTAGGIIEGTKMMAISEMQPLDIFEKKEDAKEAMNDNLDIMIMVGEPMRCPFADLVLEERNAVDCKYDPEHSSVPAGNVGLTGSPLYPHTFVGNMSEAQYGYPLEYYSDNNESRDVYYGLYSLIG
jgi:hypothetical protein